MKQRWIGGEEKQTQRNSDKHAQRERECEGEGGRERERERESSWIILASCQPIESRQSESRSQISKPVRNTSHRQTVCVCERGGGGEGDGERERGGGSYADAP